MDSGGRRMSGTRWTYMGQVIEDGFYMLKNGELYKCDPRIRFPIAKSVNIMTGEIHYPTNADRIRSMTNEELASWFGTHACCMSEPFVCNKPGGSCRNCWLKWLKEDVQDG